METIKELREELVKTFQGLKSGLLELKTAAEMNNSAGKIINTIRHQLEYSKLRKEKPDIKFMKCH